MYGSTESGRLETYVTPFPGPGGKWQISTTGGAWARWSRDGNEIFYLAADNKLMTAAVNGTGSSFTVGAVKPLFDAPRPSANRYHYDVSPDGRRFLIARFRGAETSAPITVVLNWTEGLNR